MRLSKGGTVVISIGLALAAVFLISLYMGIKSKKNIKQNGVFTKGELFEAGGKYIKVRYFVDGKEYIHGMKEPFENLQNNEFYEVRYLKDNPEKVSIFFSNPIFDESEFDTTICTKIEARLSIVIYEYGVNGQQYRGNTYFEEGMPLSKNECQVAFKVSNPSIGYLVSPKSETDKVE